MKSSGTPSESYSRNASSPGTGVPAAAARSSDLLEPRQAGRQHRVEPLFFAAHDADDRVAVAVCSSGYASPISATTTSTSVVEERLA